jgi:hypothetical protein
MPTTTTTQPSGRHDPALTPGQQVAVQLAVQRWALTQRGPTSPPDDPCNPFDPAA